MFVLNPRWHSHFFSWGYGRLLSLLIQLPADLSSKETMAETCRSRGYQKHYRAFNTIKLKKIIIAVMD
jgi:hypothetical protein